jgi:predicted AlkP superfamily phosphohydrolase/phosphomutase
VSVRVLILGLDALDAETLDDAIARGLAPTMASLRDEGSHVSLRSVADCFAGAVWPTLYSGQTPGHHNVADHFRLRPGSYDVAPAFVGDGAVIGAQVGAWPPVKTLLFDVPKVPISRRPGDSEIAGWAVHAGRGVAARWPRSLDRVLRRAPSSVLHDGEQESDRDDARWRRSLADRLVENLRRRAAVAEALLAQARWELAWVVEGETHAGGHRLFDAPAELDRVVLEADRWVAALKAAAGPRVALLVVSGHGLQAGRTGRAHLLPWLLRWSGLDEGPPSESGGWFAAREVLGAPARDRLRRALPVAVRHRLRAQLMASSFGAPRWPEMDAFPLPSEDHGYVRLNLRGREPAGRLSTADGAALLDALEEDLLGWRCVDSGRPVVRAVHRPQHRFPGPFADRLPDLVATWSGEGPLHHRLRSPRVGVLDAVSALDHRAAEHAARGFLLSNVRGLSPEGDLVDVAPTALTLLKREVPKRVEGRSLL